MSIARSPRLQRLPGLIMDLYIRNATGIEISEITPLFDDATQEDWYQRSIKIKYKDEAHHNEVVELTINLTTDDKFDCPEAAKKNLGVNIA